MAQLSKRVKTVTGLYPISVAAAVAGAVAYVDTKGYKRARVIIQVGTLTTDKTVDAYVAEGATTSPATKITGSDITQIVGASSDASKLVIIEVNLSGADRKRYIRPIITVGAAGTALLSCVIELYQGAQMPAAEPDELVEV